MKNIIRKVPGLLFRHSRSVSSLFEFITLPIQQSKTSRRVNGKQCRVSKSDFEIKDYYVCSNAVAYIILCVRGDRYYSPWVRKKYHVFTAECGVLTCAIYRRILIIWVQRCNACRDVYYVFYIIISH